MVTAIIMYLLGVLLDSYNAKLGKIVLTADDKEKIICIIAALATILIVAFFTYSEKDWQSYGEVREPYFIANGTVIISAITTFVMTVFNATDRQVLIAISIISLIEVIVLSVIFVVYAVKYKCDKFSLFSKFVDCEVDGIVHSIGYALIVYFSIACITIVAFILVIWALSVIEDFF